MAKAASRSQGEVLADVLDNLFGNLTVGHRALVLCFLLGHVSKTGESVEKMYAGLLIERAFENHPHLKQAYGELMPSA